MFRSSLIAMVLLVLFTGCGKDIEEYNKPAEYWYEKMVKAVGDANLEKADGYFSGDHQAINDWRAKKSKQV